MLDIAQACGGEILSGDSGVSASVVSTDTRSLVRGDLFFALKGDHFDGTRFAAAAAEAGAVGVVVEDRIDPLDGATVILVPDVLRALQLLAAHERRRPGFQVVGVTGSSGKTSVKDMISAVLRSRYRVVATKGNLNNHIGLPLSILAAGSEDEVGVFEMGMNHPGEIAPLAEMAAPDIGVVTNVGTAHIEHMGTREAIADEKAALLDSLGSDGVGVIPSADDFSDLLASRCPGRCVRAGEGGEISVSDLRETTRGVTFVLALGEESGQVTLPYPGRHMALNAALAAAVGDLLEVPFAEIVQALSNVELAGGRLQRREIGGVVFLDDSYNANPDSMAAGIRTLGDSPVSGGRRIAVLGRMAEIGDRAAEEHRLLGGLVSRAGIDMLCTVGAEPALAWEAADAIAGESFDNTEACAAYLQRTLRPGDLVLIKGSRSSGMERVLEHYATTCSN